MEKVLGAGYTGLQLKQFLTDNCENIEKRGYMKQFDPDQLSDMKEELSETAIGINDLEEEKKELARILKEKMSPLKAEKSRLLKLIKQKSEFVNEDCFKFIDFDSREVGFYNADGLLIESRPMQSTEAQLTIKHSLKTGTHN